MTKLLNSYLQAKYKITSWLLEKPESLKNLNLSVREAPDEQKGCTCKLDCDCETECDCSSDCRCYDNKRWDMLEATAIAIIVVTFLAIALSFIF